MAAAEDGGWTTTFKVADLDLSEDEFLKLFAKSGGGDYYEEENMHSVWQDALLNLAAAAVFPENVVLERHGFDIQPRSV